MKLALTKSAGLLKFAAPLALASCGGGGGSSSSGSGSGTQSISLSPLVSQSAMSMTSLSLKASGVQPGTAATINFTNASGTLRASVKAISTKADGTVVSPVPLCFDIDGKNTQLSLLISVTQGNVTSNAQPITIQPLPTLAALGVAPGAISKAFLRYQAMTLGLCLNRLQALQMVAINKTDTTDAQKALQAQISQVLKLRRTIVQITSGQLASTSMGPAGGQAFVFDASSIDIMDRALALYMSILGYIPEISTVATSTTGEVAAGTTKSLLSSLSPSSLKWLTLSQNTDSLYASARKLADTSTSMSERVASFASSTLAVLDSSGFLEDAGKLAQRVAKIGGFAGMGMTVYQTQRDAQAIIARSRGFSGLTQEDVATIGRDLFDSFDLKNPEIGIVNTLSVGGYLIDLGILSLIKTFYTPYTTANRENAGLYPPLGRVNVSLPPVSEDANPISARIVGAPGAAGGVADPDGGAQVELPPGVKSPMIVYQADSETGSILAQPGQTIDISGLQPGGNLDLRNGPSNSAGAGNAGTQTGLQVSGDAASWVTRFNPTKASTVFDSGTNAQGSYVTQITWLVTSGNSTYQLHLVADSLAGATPKITVLFAIFDPSLPAGQRGYRETCSGNQTTCVQPQISFNHAARSVTFASEPLTSQTGDGTVTLLSGTLTY